MPRGRPSRSSPSPTTDAFSAAYLLASAAERVYAGRTSGLGSIGVIVSHLDVSASDEKLGYKYTIIHAGARKADFNPHEPLSEEARAVIEAERRAHLRAAGERGGEEPRACPKRRFGARRPGSTSAAMPSTPGSPTVLGTRQDALTDLRNAIGGGTAASIQRERKNKHGPRTACG